MELSHIPILRLISQNIHHREALTPTEVVKKLTAVQAQDYLMAKWAVGLRSQSVTDASVEAAFNTGEILRTHILRPTWHLVAPEDIFWIQKLTSPFVQKIAAFRKKQLGLNEQKLHKAYGILEAALAGGKQLTREQIVKLCKDKGLHFADPQAYNYICMSAELDCLICSGALHGKSHTYALFDERVPVKKIMNEEEALAKLAYRYFSSHGPAAVEDFSWWSGLSISFSKRAVAAASTNLKSALVQNSRFYFSAATDECLEPAKPLYFLPAYDEYLISYRDRSHTLRADIVKNVITVNGIFKPVAVYKGEVVAYWGRATKKDVMFIEVVFLRKVHNACKKLILNAAEEYGAYLNKSIEILFKEI